MHKLPAAWFRIYIAVRLQATWKPQTWQDVELPANSLVTSYRNLATCAGASLMQVRSALEHFRVTHIAAVETTQHHTIITLLNVKTYQRADETHNTPNGAPDNTLAAPVTHLVTHQDRAGQHTDNTPEAPESKADAAPSADTTTHQEPAGQHTSQHVLNHHQEDNQKEDYKDGNAKPAPVSTSSSSTTRDSKDDADDAALAFVSAIRSQWEDLPMACDRWTKSNEKTAAEWFKKGVSVETARRAILLGSNRKYQSECHKGTCDKVTSLKYFTSLLDDPDLKIPSDPYWVFAKNRLLEAAK